MLRERDKKIIEALQLFRCMSRDQIAHIFFADVKNPITSANFVLKRLRRETYIDAYVDRQPYIYFPEPSIIKKDSQKTNHYLAIVDFYIEICRYEKPSVFEVEKRYRAGQVQPDIFMIWQGKAYFVEIQLSRYSSVIMKEKLNRYASYLETDEWSEKYLTYNLNTRPYVWIVSKSPYTILNEDLLIIQTSNTAIICNN
ncbi:replication-relaxation family protein [Bacillus toyonensis]|uniref:replication-relaxation family protein n=1 Tax=Bacillus toyonensis TaxID=155322 RepID=UPI0018A15349|nr:replication-relaxation family protein [Bacillus toyonensis]MBF7150822.1 replication-relaxation family protein [Bacillus toyonensis]MEC2351412.1 replication-relaxation family protein [Bacillus toyonensis]MED3188828.1 replication-relaxation family protein [Bacillus toyonensis]